MTSEILSQTTRLWFHFITYFRKDKYKSRHFVKKESSGYQRRYQNNQEQTIEKKNRYRSWDSNV